MIRRPVTWLAVLLLGGALLAGCGSSSTTTSQSTSTPAATTAGSSSGTTATPGGAAAIATPQAVEACKHAIQAQQSLPASSKSKLEAVCARAATGDTAAVKQAAREVCEEVVNRSPVPAFAKEQAIAACKSRTK
jgi:NAD(P)H-hydrate repair Nnr-like enzyme with NAD(P)H-hydrate dehydratase domain